MPYHPFLFARQAELRAVDMNAARFGTPQQIWPLLEPVDAFDKLGRSLARMTVAGRGAFVVVNPVLGKLASPTAQAAWSSEAAGQIAASALIRPVLKEQPSTTASDLAAFVANYPGRPVGVVLTSSKLTGTALSGALSGAPVTVFASHAGALAAASAAGLNPVHLGDNFRAEARNSDYTGAEWLGNNHVGAAGKDFADFTVLPSTFVAGGGPIGAAAIHLTYQETDDSFWVQHFVSDEHDRNVGTAQSKIEAIAHIQAQMTATPGRFVATPALATYLSHLSAGTTTSLSGNKTLQISHHLDTVASYMGI